MSFEQWYDWLRQRHPEECAPMDELKPLWDAYYACDCAACQYRKERGYLRFRIGPDCRYPMQSLGIEQLRTLRKETTNV